MIFVIFSPHPHFHCHCSLPFNVAFVLTRHDFLLCLRLLVTLCIYFPIHSRLSHFSVSRCSVRPSYRTYPLLLTHPPTLRNTVLTSATYPSTNGLYLISPSSPTLTLPRTFFQTTPLPFSIWSSLIWVSYIFSSRALSAAVSRSVIRPKYSSSPLLRLFCSIQRNRQRITTPPMMNYQPICTDMDLTPPLDDKKKISLVLYLYLNKVKWSFYCLRLISLHFPFSVSVFVNDRNVE